MARMIVNLREHERTALWQLAQREYRTPRDLAAVIIRKELERQGLLGMAPAFQTEKEEHRERSGS
jgi:hypothetical protein